jgi:S1-C subfamily serine protease
MESMRTLRRAHPLERFWWLVSRAGMLALLGMTMTSLGFAATAWASSSASEGLCTAARRGVALALPAVVRVATTYQAQVNYTTADGSSVTFPQDGGYYALMVSGTGAFISGTGDVLTASSAVSVASDTLNTLLAERAAPDIAQALNDSNPSQTVTAATILNQLLTDPQVWEPQIQQPQTTLYLSSQYSGPTQATTLENVPSYPGAIVAQSATNQQVDNDLTILHVEGLRDVPTIFLGDATQVYQGDTLSILGYPGSADLPGSDGAIAPNNFLTASVQTVTVSAFKTAANGSQLLQIDGDVEQGDGGAPALNVDGQLVGVVSSAASGSNPSGQVSFLHTANDAKNLAQQAKVNLAQDTFDKRWAAAYDACSSTAPGHWHDAYNQYTQLARQYPTFKGVALYVSYTKTQAAREGAPGLNLPGWALGLIAAVLLGGVVGIMLLIRQRGLRRKETYVGFGPGLYHDPAAGGSGLEMTVPAGQQRVLPVASEQIGAAIPAGGLASNPIDPLAPTLTDAPPGGMP